VYFTFCTVHSLISTLFPYTTLFRSFVLITLLTVLSMAGVFFLMDRVEPKPSSSIKDQLATLKNRKIFFGQSITFLFMTGHTILRSEEHTSELQSRFDLVCRLLLEKK